jgi:hypothetical protein
LPIVERFTEPLYVPGVEHRYIEGAALRYTLFLPLRTMQGEEVFSRAVERWLMELFNHHFLGSTHFRSRPVPLLMGAWPGQFGTEYELVNIFTIYSRFAEDVTHELFRQVGIILRGLSVPEQDDILIECLAVDLISCRRDDEPLERRRG